MSHYARLVTPLTTRTVATGERVDLGNDTEIKRITVNDQGGFDFEARVHLPAGPAWVVVRTDEDLPAFTDKGRAHRARSRYATLQPGRPLEGEEVRPVAVRVSATQKEWIAKRAARKEVTVSEYLRALLEREGMPS